MTSTPPIDRETTPVILAGGHSRRFGDEDKLRARLGGRTLVEHVSAALRSATGRAPVVAVRDDAQREALAASFSGAEPVRFVTDVAAYEGPIAGALAGVRAAETPWVFLCGGDMPLVTSAGITALTTHDAPQATPQAIVPVDADGFEPLHALYRTDSLCDAIEAIEGNAGICTVLDGFDSVTRVPIPSHVSPMHCSLFDVDTVEDLRTLRERRSPPTASRTTTPNAP